MDLDLPALALVSIAQTPFGADASSRARRTQTLSVHAGRYCWGSVKPGTHSTIAQRQWAFYGNSRARTGKWCSMKVCGNRAKQKARRDRGRRG